MGDETITLQARNFDNTSEIEGDHLTHSTKTDNTIQPTLREMSLKEAHESFSSISRGPIHEDRRLQIEELDEWQTHKPRTPDKLNLRQNNSIPFQINLRLEIESYSSNEEIHLTVLSIFPSGTIEVSHPKFSTFKVSLPAKRPELDAALGLYTEEFKEENELHALTRHIHSSPSKCWHTLAPSAASYNPSRSKASVLPPSLSVCCTGTSLTLPISSPSRFSTRQSRTYPPQYRLAQSTEEEAYEDIPDDVPPQYEDPPTQPPPPSHPVHATASYADIYERLTRFEQQCFQ
ncbi:hypothetical protein GOBAR_AA01402 [Gossypium barbadense]|uniref:Uncharacterized protein n=1 Tax=Gossypium barbadense TaxID=3634 RepID=A0A2P5YU82_GOSBA|nr:hypothetical protein GOBAR_AA01402 [Gossypium barbadense]